MSQRKVQKLRKCLTCEKELNLTAAELKQHSIECRQVEKVRTVVLR